MNNQKLDDQELKQASGGVGENIPSADRAQISIAAVRCWGENYSLEEAQDFIQVWISNGKYPKEDVYALVAAIYEDYNNKKKKT